MREGGDDASKTFEEEEEVGEVERASTAFSSNTRNHSFTPLCVSRSAIVSALDMLSSTAMCALVESR